MTTDARQQEIGRIAGRLIEQTSPLCDCPCKLDGPKNSPDSIYRTEHTDKCIVRTYIREAFQAGRLSGLQQAAEIAEAYWPMKTAGKNIADLIREKIAEGQENAK